MPKEHTPAAGDSEAAAALTRLILSELSCQTGRYVSVGELTKLTHTLAPDVARTVRRLETSGLIVTSRRKGAIVVQLVSPSMAET